MKNNYSYKLAVTLTFPKMIDKKYVLCGVSAMCYNGMSVDGMFMPQVYTTHKELNKFEVSGKIQYFYNENIDYENYVYEMRDFPNILIPTIERAIVSNIKENLEFIDEGSFLDAMYRSFRMNNYSYDKLIEVAEFYGVSKDEIDYWIEEALEYGKEA